MNGTDSKQGSNVVLSESQIVFKDRSWWQRRSTLEKGLVVVVGVAVLAVAGLVAAVIVVAEKKDHKINICTTEDCVNAAAKVSYNLDHSVKPCDNFFEFACGGWLKKTVIPEDRSNQNTFGILRDEVDVILKGLLETPVKSTDITAVKHAKAFYASCLNTTILNSRSDEPLQELIQQYGGWPVLEASWDPSGFRLEDALIQLRKDGFSPLIYMYVYTDSKNSKGRIMYVDQPGFGMPGRKYYLRGRNDKMVLAYEDLLRKIAIELGADPTQAENDAREIVDFEIELANISVASEDRRDSEKLYNKFTIRSLSQNYTGFDWTRYLTQLMTWADVPVSGNEPVINESPPYFSKFLQLMARTSDRLKANYIMWYMVFSNINYLTDTYRDLVQDYNKVLYGTSSTRARFRICSSATVSRMGLAVGRLFVESVFDEESKHTAKDMIADLRVAFNQLVNELDWMDEHTKDLARNKAKFIEEKIGFPETVTDDAYLNNRYANLTFEAGTYFENVQLNRKYNSWKYLHRLREPVDRLEWTTAPSTVNAYYSFDKNLIMFPAGILQPPFFSKTFPNSMNYGGIGVVIGHEITHGFDDRGRQYDKIGNLLQWWSDDAIAKFKDKAQCIVDQYSNFYLPEADLNVNGINTQGENIADNGGLKQSFRAYRNWVAKRGKEELPLPGLNFTHNQLFFINFAQIWCEKMRSQSAINRVLTGVHSPGRFRVIGTLQNSRDFAEAFNCPRTSYMNPEKKCYVW